MQAAHAKKVGANFRAGLTILPYLPPQTWKKRDNKVPYADA